MIKRKILSRLEGHLPSDQVTVLIGPRQVGKTYLMQLLREKLVKGEQRTVWLNLDNDEDAGKFASQETLLSHLELTVGKRRAFVFIDEIQRKENAGLFLKGIYDMQTPYKFIVSGSGSLDIKSKISESMAGRKRLFTVDPISFEEFVNYKTNYRYEDRLPDFFSLEGSKTNRLLLEHMGYGGYPRVVLAETTTEKQTEMQEIYRSYVDRDIRALLHLERTDALHSLLKILASQIGGLVNVTELQSTVALDNKTLKHYLSYLEQTFILKRVTPFHRNIRSEIAKTPVYYFVDTGLRNWLLSLFGLPEIPPPLAGHLFENFIFNTLCQQIELAPTEVHFWRSRDQAEVDFVLETGLRVTPVEVKYGTLRSPEVSRSFQSFLTRYQPEEAYIIHLGEFMQKKVAQTLVHYLPFYGLGAIFKQL